MPRDDRLGLIAKGETRRQVKDKSRALACRYWPDSAKLFSRAKDDGRAEAALIASIGQRLAQPQANQPALPMEATATPMGTA